MLLSEQPEFDSEKLLELTRGQAGVPDNAAHRDRIHRVVPRNCQDPATVSQDDVLTLPYHPKPRSFERPHSSKVRDPGYFGHDLRRDFHFP